MENPRDPVTALHHPRPVAHVTGNTPLRLGVYLCLRKLEAVHQLVLVADAGPHARAKPPEVRDPAGECGVFIRLFDLALIPRHYDIGLELLASERVLQLWNQHARLRPSNCEVQALPCRELVPDPNSLLTTVSMIAFMPLL